MHSTYNSKSSSQIGLNVSRSILSDVGKRLLSRSRSRSSESEHEGRHHKRSRSFQTMNSSTGRHHKRSSLSHRNSADRRSTSRLSQGVNADIVRCHRWKSRSLQRDSMDRRSRSRSSQKGRVCRRSRSRSSIRDIAGTDRQHERNSRFLQRGNSTFGRKSRSRSYQRVNSGSSRQHNRSRSRSSQRCNAGRRSLSLDLPPLVQRPRHSTAKKSGVDALQGKIMQDKFPMTEASEYLI